VKFEGHYYYASSGGKIIADRTYWVSNTNGLMDTGAYQFDAEGKMVLLNGVVDQNGVKYYYVDGKQAGVGLVAYEGKYYYFGNGGIAYMGKPIWISKTNGLLEAGTYCFAEDGAVILTTYLSEYDGFYYYYLNGRRTADAGIVQIGEDCYFIGAGGKAAVSTTLEVEKTNGLISAGTYYFDEAGKLQLHHRVVDGYYYYEGERTAAGLVKINGNYYYARYGGKVVANESFWIENTKDMLPAGMYRFDESGKIIMTTELVNEDGTLYYYEDGRRINHAGMLLIDGSYYYIGNGGAAVTNQSYWASKTNGLLEEGMYRFAADGKIIMAEALVNEDGTLYYYKDGRRINNAGVLLIDGNYYCIISGAIAVTNDKVWVYKPNGLVEEGTYRFDEQGRMIRSTGIVYEDDGYYYRLNGRYVENAGLVEYEGAYYYILEDAKAVTDQIHWVELTNDLVKEGNYTFGPDGKMIP